MTEHDGSLIPSAYILRPVCGTDGVMVRVSRTPPYAPLQTVIEGGYVEIRDPSGHLLFSAMTPPDDATWMETGIGWHEYWAFGDPESTEPRVRVYRLTLSTP